MATKKTVKTDSDQAKAKNNSETAKEKAKKKEPMSLKSLMYPIIGVVIIIIAIAAYMAISSQPPASNNGTVTPPANVTGQPTILKRCAQLANVDENYGFIKQLISNFYNTTKRTTYMYGLPETLKCGLDEASMQDYPYSLKIGDGYIITTIGNESSMSNFTKGIVIQGITIPAASIEKGVILYIEHPRQGVVGYTYELKNASSVSFDAYNPKLIEDYKLKAVPSVVFNCRTVYTARPDIPDLQIRDNTTGELVPALPESMMLKTLACALNKGKPDGVCSGLEIINGTVKLPPQLALTTFNTGAESCKPAEGVLDVKAFYEIDCANCTKQRKILDELKSEFGDSMNLKYYCVGTASDCGKFLKAN